MKYVIFDHEADKFISFIKLNFNHFYTITVISILWIDSDTPPAYTDDDLYYMLKRLNEGQLRSIKHSMIISGDEDPDFLNSYPILDWLETACMIRGDTIPSIIDSTRKFK